MTSWQKREKRPQNREIGGSPKSDFHQNREFCGGPPQNHDGLLGGSHGECACPCVDDARRSALNSPTGESPRAARPRKP